MVLAVKQREPYSSHPSIRCLHALNFYSGVSVIYSLVCSDHKMVRRAAMEVFCNMPLHDKVLKVEVILVFVVDFDVVVVTVSIIVISLSNFLPVFIEEDLVIS